MGIFKIMSRAFGGLLLVTGLFLFIFSFFITYSLGNIPILEESVDEASYELLMSEITTRSNLTESEVLALCETGDERAKDVCDAIDNPMEATGLNDSIISLEQGLKALEGLRNLGIILFLIGSLFIYLGYLNILNALFSISVKSAITSGFSIIVYKFTPNIILKALNSIIIEKNIPMEYFDIIRNVILTWLKYPINQTVILSIIFTIMFICLSILFYMLKRKRLNKDNKKK